MITIPDPPRPVGAATDRADFAGLAAMLDRAERERELYWNALLVANGEVDRLTLTLAVQRREVARLQDLLDGQAWDDLTSQLRDALAQRDTARAEAVAARAAAQVAREGLLSEVDRLSRELDEARAELTARPALAVTFRRILAEEFDARGLPRDDTAAVAERDHP